MYSENTFNSFQYSSISYDLFLSINLRKEQLHCWLIVLKQIYKRVTISTVPFPVSCMMLSRKLSTNSSLNSLPLCTLIPIKICIYIHFILSSSLKNCSNFVFTACEVLSTMQYLLLFILKSDISFSLFC